MNDLFNEIIQTGTAILISWMVVSGIVNAQPECCSAILNACIPAFNKIPARYTIGNSQAAVPSHQRNGRQQATICYINYPY